MHDPSLSRNPTMDIYNKDETVKIELTHPQIHTYYDVMRRLVKGKSYLPDDEHKSNHVAGVSKKEYSKKVLIPKVQIL